MSSSSSDSDSDEFEPIRKIKINIRPKEDVIKKGAADVSEIKASVEAWRPLGPPPHPSLSRRQSSLSSVSSVSFGAGPIYGGNNAANAAGIHGQPLIGPSGLRSSPSCSSLVNDFNNRASFSNFMSTTSRTSSPLNLINNGDVPIAIAIQESIELTITGKLDSQSDEPKFNTRAMGNIKVAFTNAFARGISNVKPPVLKLRMHSTQNITRYYASRLIKDLDLETSETVEPNNAFFNLQETNSKTNGVNKQNDKSLNLLDFDTAPDSDKIQSKLIEFDTDALKAHLSQVYDQSPKSQYYNVDVLRYQITSISSIEECPLQVCAYWKVEPKLVKLRIYFEHSSKSGLNLERLRDITFSVNFSDFIPVGVDVNSMSPNSVSTIQLNNNNNNNNALNMNCDLFSSNVSQQPATLTLPRPQPRSNCMTNPSDTQNIGDKAPKIPIRLPPPKITPRTSNNAASRLTNFDAFGVPMMPQPSSTRTPVISDNSISPNQTLIGDSLFNDQRSTPQTSNSIKTGSSMQPHITHEPQAQWNSNSKHLVWKFDNLLSYYKTDGSGSLMAKLDYRNCDTIPTTFLDKIKPVPVDVRFMVVDSTLSKISIGIDSIGYRMSLLKKEIRSGRYRSEPYIL